MPLPPLVIVGPTASGKSALALQVARSAGDAEIVSADSMQVYRGMDIGTAKPTAAERAEIEHHLLDRVDVSESYSVSDFQRDARAALLDIARRGRRAIVVGGTGLYVQALVDGFEIPPRFPEIRTALEAQLDGASELCHDAGTADRLSAMHRRLSQLDPLGASRIEPTNRRRVLRALEVTLGSGRPFSEHGPGIAHYPPTRHLLVGLHLERAELDRRIEERFQRLLSDGLLDEVRRLFAPGATISNTAAQALGYKELAAHLDGTLSLEDAVALAITRTRRFARRQQRWFRRDPRIRWIDAAAVRTNPLAVVRDQLRDWTAS